MRSFIRLTLLMLAFSSSAFALSQIPTAPVLAPQTPVINAKSYLLIDANSDKVLAEKNSEMKVEPASLTKMLTVYIIDNEIKAGKIKLTNEVLISKNAWQTTGTKMFVKVDTKVAVGDLIKGIIIQSGNDASIAMAEHIAGSEEAFAQLMNSYAQALGMHNSHFENATGLPSPNHITTAKDMAILASALIKDFPDTYKIYAEKEFTHNDIRQTNRNLLLWRNPQVDGIKTGHTDNAGYCLVASARDADDMRLISVVMGTKSDHARTEESNKLLNFGFRFYETHLVQKGGEPLQVSKIWMGRRRNLAVGFEDDLYITTVRGSYKKYNATVNVLSLLKAPITKGDVVGTYVIQDGNKQTVIEKPVVALSTIPKGNILQRGRDYVKLNVKSIFDKFS